MSGTFLTNSWGLLWGKKIHIYISKIMHNSLKEAGAMWKTLGLRHSFTVHGPLGAGPGEEGLPVPNTGHSKYRPGTEMPDKGGRDKAESC